MDAFLKYLSQCPKYKDRLFVSEPPNSVILAWSSFQDIPKISGVTIVKQIGSASFGTLNIDKIIEILKNACKNSIPLLFIEYSQDISNFIINGTRMANKNAAEYISNELKINLGSNPAKRPNDPSQINDPFHVWSRLVFDGVSVRKIDIDAIILSPELDKINSFIEIKRSNKNPIGKWTPYMKKTSGNSDYWNYIMCFSLCKILMCDFVTFHHELMKKEDVFKEDTAIEAFVFGKNTLISEETISHFSSTNNRRKFSGATFL